MISAGDMTWFRPLYRRVLLIAVCVGWVAFELVMQGEKLWLTIAILATVYSVWLSLRVHLAVKDENEKV